MALKKHVKDNPTYSKSIFIFIIYTLCTCREQLLIVRLCTVYTFTKKVKPTFLCT